ncbi:DUF4231 domain-containing protein [Actinomyces timonensis]|uniref:DUF4231 domain-containing protein n=1 Tax=Actinomyces timonensis TaxID=1288391 RepID=UPI0009E21873|nr:DUF4231 domain-containing protein [Actinomyces timonensis]
MPDPLYTAALTDADLPGTWKNADEESKRGQQLTLWLTRGKLGGGLIAAFGGATSWHVGQLNVSAWTILIGFLAAFICEIASWQTGCEQVWYEGRAVAESVKTLSWRFAVGADPFPSSMKEAQATTLLRQRISSITQEVSKQIIFDADDAIVTSKMKDLRRRKFTDRRDAYLLGRTIDQKNWYAAKARQNRRLSFFWRLTLLTFEVVAILLATGKVFGGWDIDLTGLLAAIVAAGVAWVAVKQFSPLASAYSIAANELGTQESVLKTVSEEDWPLFVADAEEAISREHTTWLASRTGHLPNWG